MDELARQGETQVSLYRQRDFVDLCRGPHLTDAGRIGPVKLLSVAGAYWRGSEENPQLTRIYATAFPTSKELEEHLERLEQARARDHRRVGRDLELFHFDEAGPGFPFFLPNGMVIVNAIKEAVREELRRMDYAEIQTPRSSPTSSGGAAATTTTIASTCTSRSIDGQGFAVEAHELPGARAWSTAAAGTAIASCRCGTPSSATSTATSCPGSCTACSGCAPSRRTTPTSSARLDQVQDEVPAVLDLTDRFYSASASTHVGHQLATRPEKAGGDGEMWDAAEEALRSSPGRRGPTS